MLLSRTPARSPHRPAKPAHIPNALDCQYRCLLPSALSQAATAVTVCSTSDDPCSRACASLTSHVFCERRLRPELAIVRILTLGSASVRSLANDREPARTQARPGA